MREIETRGVSVEAAIADGLQMLALSRDEVEIEVVDEGSRGLLGIGSREAVVRLKPLSAESGQAPVTEEATPVITGSDCRSTY
ncbi:MAG: Jag N-terminal domain-containing protein [Chloroflexota bacterium]